MFRSIVLVGAYLVAAASALASPYDRGFEEDFEDGELEVGLYADLLVNEIPTDPTQSYVAFTSPSWDGSTGLLLMQGEGAEFPELAFVMACWSPCVYHYGHMELAAPPTASFGTLRMSFHYGNQIVDIVYEAPGTYSFEAPEIPYLFGVKWSGTGVIVDDLQLVALCGCVPNEASSWGMVKAMYR